MNSSSRRNRKKDELRRGNFGEPRYDCIRRLRLLLWDHGRVAVDEECRGEKRGIRRDIRQTTNQW